MLALWPGSRSGALHPLRTLFTFEPGGNADRSVPLLQSVFSFRASKAYDLELRFFCGRIYSDHSEVFFPTDSSVGDSSNGRPPAEALGTDCFLLAIGMASCPALAGHSAASWVWAGHLLTSGSRVTHFPTGGGGGVSRGGDLPPTTAVPPPPPNAPLQPMSRLIGPLSPGCHYSRSTGSRHRSR